MSFSVLSQTLFLENTSCNMPTSGLTLLSCGYLFLLLLFLSADRDSPLHNPCALSILDHYTSIVSPSIVTEGPRCSQTVPNGERRTGKVSPPSNKWAFNCFSTEAVPLQRSTNIWWRKFWNMTSWWPFRTGVWDQGERKFWIHDLLVALQDWSLRPLM